MAEGMDNLDLALEKLASDVEIFLEFDEDNEDVEIDAKPISSDTKTVEVSEVLTILQRLTSSYKEFEAKLASDILDRIRKKDCAVRNFVEELNSVISSCYDSVRKVKKEQVKMLTLEKEFGRQRSAEQSHLFDLWQQILDPSERSKSESKVVYQHIMQHIWGYAILRTASEAEKQTVQNKKQKQVDSVERVAIRQHAGWAIKRARDTIVASNSPISIKQSSTDSKVTEVTKEYLLDLIARLGKDELQEPGKFMFVPFPNTDDFFITLTNEAEQLLKQETNLKQMGKNVVIWSLKQLSTSATLREKWDSLLGKSSGYSKAAHIVLLQRVVTMFLKSKQQIIREQLQLKPQKSSHSLRQSLPKSSGSDKPGTSKAKSQSPGSEKGVPPLVNNLRKSIESEESVRQFLTCLQKEKDTKAVLQFLTGRELIRILKSLDLPSFSGKSKSKQIDTLANYLSTVEVVHIKHPDKLALEV